MGHPLLSHRISRRKALTLAGIGAATLPLTACVTNSSAQNPAAITIGYVPIACTAPLIVADALGHFKANGLTIKLRKYAGWADLWSAYATGDIHIAHMLSPMPIAINAGVTNGTRPTELVFTQNTNGQAIVLGKKHENTVTTADDFRGMTIGIPFEFSVHLLLLRDFLTANNVDPDRDLELRLLRPSDMIAQLQIGTIDGFIGPEPFIQRAVATKAGFIFTLTKNLWEDHPCCSIAVAKDWKAAHPTETAGIIAALAAGAEAAGDHDHAPDIAHTLGQEKYLNQPEKLFIPALKEPDRINFGTPTNPTAITWMATQISRWNLGGTPPAWDDATLIQLAESVLPTNTPRGTNTLTINGKPFDANLPTAGYKQVTPR
ncbi:MAG: ABC transporter substrate-binding protein [Corynebacterium sp.]|nr:ABC transporter substrate-binding protein [Corynebacterium sp.]